MFSWLVHLPQTTQLALVLVCVVVVASLSRLLKQPLLAGYLIAGVLIGTLGLGSLSADHTGGFFTLFSELGIALLLFLVGLGLNPATIKEHGKTALLVGLIQIAVCTVLGFLLTWGIGFSRQVSLLISLSMSFSSTIVIVKMLHDMQDADMLYGRISIGILIVQDIVAMILLMSLALLWSGDGGGTHEKLMLLEGIGLIAGVIAIAKWIMPHVLPRMAQTHELMLLIGVGRCLLLGSLFKSVGFSYEIGCLLAGMSFALSPWRRAMMEKLQSLRDFFIVIFFVHVGMLVDISIFASYRRQIALLTLFVVLCKPALTYFIISFFGHSKKVSFKTAMTLGQMSEFGLILLTLGGSLGIIQSPDAVSVILIVALFSILFSSYFITHNNRLAYFWARRVRDITKEQKPACLTPVDVAVLGYGKFGLRIAHLLRDQGFVVGIMESNPHAFSQAEQDGYVAYYADATNKDSLRECFGSQLKMVISSLREFDDDWIIAHHIKDINPKTIMVSLTLHQEYSVELYDAGCDYVLLPYHISAHHMAGLIEELQYDLSRFLEKKSFHRDIIAVLLTNRN